MFFINNRFFIDILCQYFLYGLKEELRCVFGDVNDIVVSNCIALFLFPIWTYFIYISSLCTRNRIITLTMRNKLVNLTILTELTKL